MRNLVLLAMVVLSLPGCETDRPEDVLTDQKILFHYSYENWAWGHQFYGWYIDNLGQVWSTKSPIHWCDEVMNVVSMKNEDIWIDREHTENTYENSKDSLLMILDLDEMEDRYKLIGTLVNSEYTHPVNTGCDMGSAIYGCLYYDPGQDMYKRIILKAWGDWSFMLPDSTSTILIEWFDSLYAAILYP